MSYHNGPRIVTNGLVLYLDAGNSKSYPGSGTVWNDLSGNNNNGTLINGPIYSSANKGSIVFDGIDDSVTLESSSSLFPGPSINAAIDFFILPSIINTQQVYIGILNPNGHRLYIGNYNGLWDIGFGDYAWNTNFTGSRVSVNPRFTHVCLNINQGLAVLFVNSQQTITKTLDTSVSISGIFSIGAFFNLGNYNSNFSKACTIPNIKIYNRSLTLSEIQQNYNATKGRYNS